MPEPQGDVAGDLTLTRTDGGSLREPGGRSTQVVTIQPPTAVVGRSDEADVCVVDDANVVSRSHLLIELRGGTWWVYDDHSSHGSYVKAPSRPRAVLPPGVGIALENKMELWLAKPGVPLVVGLRRKVLAGRPTAAGDTHPSDVTILAENDRLVVARAIVIHRNARAALDALSAEGSPFKERTFRNRLTEIAALREVRAAYEEACRQRSKDPAAGTHAEALAEALERLFPSLTWHKD